MKVEMWFDFVCPFCYIGKRNIEEALKDYDDVEFVYHAFELDQNISKEYDDNIYKFIANKYRMTIDQSMEMHKSMLEMAEESGLVYNFDILKMTNSMTSHRLAKYAIEKGKGYDFIELIDREYYANGAKLNDDNFLIESAKKVGLDENEVREVLNSDKYYAAVREDEKLAKEMKVSGAPFFLINDKHRIPGAQTVETFRNKLKMIEEKDNN